MPVIEPVTATIGGAEYQFRLSHGTIRRIKAIFQAKKWSEVMARMSEEEDPIPILYQMLADKGSLTEDQFADAIPFAETPKLMKVLEELMTGQFYEARPTQPPAEVIEMHPKATSTGPTSGDSPESASA
jgi:hypothetical protein